MVRLRPAIMSCISSSISAFQSHYGAIATHLGPIAEYERVRNFNPTMVRLRPGFCGVYPHKSRFSIPLWCDCDDYVKAGCEIEEGFQSHYSAIATALQHETEVRLHSFQSHYGAIATEIFKAGLPEIAEFQSHYGAIATICLLSSWPLWIGVSIPLWCDCDQSLR